MEKNKIVSGWYFAGLEKELTTKKNLCIEFMEKQLVVFRTESNRICTIDAYCPHLGAYMGFAKVKKDTLECPLHHFRFNTNGNCVSVPYSDRNDFKINTKTYPTKVVNGAILFYMNTKEEPPTWKSQKGICLVGPESTIQNQN